MEKFMDKIKRDAEEQVREIQRALEEAMRGCPYIPQSSRVTKNRNRVIKGRVS